jgi:hypothetical protein
MILHPSDDCSHLAAVILELTTHPIQVDVQNVENAIGLRDKILKEQLCVEFKRVISDRNFI